MYFNFLIVFSSNCKVMFIIGNLEITEKHKVENENCLYYYSVISMTLISCTFSYKHTFLHKHRDAHICVYVCVYIYLNLELCLFLLLVFLLWL